MLMMMMGVPTVKRRKRTVESGVVVELVVVNISSTLFLFLFLLVFGAGVQKVGLLWATT